MNIILNERGAKSKISKLLERLGGVVLLPCDGKRPVISGWQKLTTKLMEDNQYLKRLERTRNTGVLLGKASAGLCVLDFDADGEDEKFLALNPSLRSTLRTRGRRGSSLWVRILGDFPRSTKLTRNGEDVGEFRADGNQSIISGVHPDTGKPYRILTEASPIEIPFEKILWPDYVNFSKGRSPNCKPKIKKSKPQSTGEPPILPSSTTPFTEEQVVKKCTCKNSHTSNRKLFNLARGIKTLERQRGSDFLDEDFKRVFDVWYKSSLPYLRPGSRENYFEEFLQAYDCAIRGLDENALMIAWQNAQTAPLPECASKFKSPKIQMLVVLCAELQKLAGEQSFYLSCRKAGPLLAVSHKHASRWLNSLIREKILAVVKKGGPETNRATRYRFAPLSLTASPKPEVQNVIL